MTVDDFADLPPQILSGLHSIHQVRPVKRADEDLRNLQLKLPHHVVAHALRGRRRVGMHGDSGKQFFQPPQRAIFRPEVVAPLANAMRLIDGEERHREVFKEIERALHHQPLGGQVQQLDATRADVGRNFAFFAGQKRAVHAGGRHTAIAQSVDLILHQGNEGRNDHRQAGLTEGRRLKAE